MSVLNELAAYTGSILGVKVERAAATLPQTTTDDLFTVSGGKVAIVGIIGEVTTVIQDQANNTKLTANPTTGTSKDICAVLNIANDEAGTLYSITGTVSDAMDGTTAGCVAMQAKPVVVNTGTIELSCAASNTGAIKWTLFYVPIDTGASVVAA